MSITLPDLADLDQNEEYCDVEVGGRSRRIRFHDYGDIYDIPGMYEKLFAELLECRSPQVLVDLLGAALEAADEKPESLRVLDFGAGNGMVGEELVNLGVELVIGSDLLPQAKAAALRDRPEIYRDYVDADITALTPEQTETLRAADLNAMTCVAALGFDDIPPAAFAAAFNAIAEEGWVAFNLRDRYLDAPTAFSTLLERMIAEGLLTEMANERYIHRKALGGRSLEYVAFVGRKHGHIPAGWVS